VPVTQPTASGAAAGPRADLYKQLGDLGL
jgi:hypothetical protein